MNDGFGIAIMFLDTRGENRLSSHCTHVPRIGDNVNVYGFGDVSIHGRVKDVRWNIDVGRFDEVIVVIQEGGGP